MAAVLERKPRATQLKKWPHVKLAEKYARDVLAGKIPACKSVHRALSRHLGDLKRSQQKSYPWKFDPEKAEKICSFVELTPHIKGPLRGQLIKLEPWQCFILCCVFGWISKETGFRRFREAYVEVPGGNGKTALSAPIGLFMLSLDGEGGAEVYAAATTRDQAKLVFESAQNMARWMPEFRQRFGVEVLAHSIYQQRSASRFIPMSAEAGTSEGINVHCAIIDELHKHSSRAIYDVIKNHMGKRSQPLVWIITTAGSDRAGVCYEVRDYVTKILEGVCEDDRIFGIIYTLDEADDWTLESSWQKANPNWGVSVFPDAIEAEAKQALQVASKQPAFQTKHLDIWVNADHAWMDMQKWAKCENPELTEADVAELPCIVAVDLASKLDLLAKVKIFWQPLEGKAHYYIFGTYWTPEAMVESSRNAQYQGWAIDKRLLTCPGETNDYGLVLDSIREDCRKFNVLEVAIDEYQAVFISNDLMREGITVVEIPQRVKYLSHPMAEVEAAVYDGRLHHNGDPVMTWNISNVVCHRDANDNMFPRKERAQNKIDAATALFTGLNRVMANAELPDPEASSPFFV